MSTLIDHCKTQINVSLQKYQTDVIDKLLHIRILLQIHTDKATGFYKTYRSLNMLKINKIKLDNTENAFQNYETKPWHERTT